MNKDNFKRYFADKDESFFCENKQLRERSASLQVDVDDLYQDAHAWRAHTSVVSPLQQLEFAFMRLWDETGWGLPASITAALAIALGVLDAGYWFVEYVLLGIGR